MFNSATMSESPKSSVVLDSDLPANIEKQSLVETVDLDLPGILEVPDVCISGTILGMCVPRDVIMDIYKRLCYANTLESCLDIHGINKEIFYNTMRWGSEHLGSDWYQVYRLFERGMNRPVQVCLESVLKAAGQKNWQAGAWVLERVYGMNGKTNTRKTVKGGVAAAEDNNDVRDVEEVRNEIEKKLMGLLRDTSAVMGGDKK